MGGKLIGNKVKNVYRGKFERLIEGTVPRRQISGLVRIFLYIIMGGGRYFCPQKRVAKTP